MEKNYQPQATEEKIYQLWEKGGYFTPKIDKKKKPFSILLPLPNANDPIHMGHCLFAIQDILARYHRMLGEPTLWLPGADHAGIETQFVFEKKLAKEGQSRFDFDRETLYRMIADFVEENRQTNISQLKRMGFSLDWSRYHYSLEPKIVATVLKTFRQLHRDGLIYRGNRMVNYCPKCGTAYSELEVEHQERDDFLYCLDYGPLQIATTRPETIFADVAVAVNPRSKKYAQLVGFSAELPLVSRKLPIIADELVDPDFGTGALKITPAHDPTDFEIGQKHQLAVMSVIDRNGRLINVPEKYLGLKVGPAREAVIEDLTAAGKLIKTEPLKHVVGVCYRCGTTIEPMLMPQWFVKIAPLAKPALAAVKEGQTKIVPGKRFEKMYFSWMEKIHDWNISRQIVWGPRIPAWYRVDGNEEKLFVTFKAQDGQLKQGPIGQLLKEGIKFEEIEKGIQQLSVPLYEAKDENPEVFIGEEKPPKGTWIQETDTFDTWFLSGQWPLTTLGYPDGEDFKYFYPTSVMDTLWDILFFWVARMMMFGLYLTKEVPFKTVHIHARVVDKHGQKMSKSKGNVINPINMVDHYGADALRLALVIGVAPAGDVAISEEKIKGMRNFCNKLWNIGRFIILNCQNKPVKDPSLAPVKSPAGQWAKVKWEEVGRLAKNTTKLLENFRFGQASEELYQYTWHQFADLTLEEAKTWLKEENEETAYVRWLLLESLKVQLKLFHPFIPFITEEIWQKLPGPTEPLIISSWPK